MVTIGSITRAEPRGAGRGSRLAAYKFTTAMVMCDDKRGRGRSMTDGHIKGVPPHPGGRLVSSLMDCQGLIPFRNLNSSLSVDNTRVVPPAMMSR